MQVAELTLNIAVVSFAEPDELAEHETELRLDIDYYSDPDRAAYAAFGFGRASIMRVWLDPRVWAAYARLLAKGQRPKRFRQDKLQMGGDVLVREDGTIAWVCRSTGPEDRPSVSRIRAVAMTVLRSSSPARPS